MSVNDDSNSHDGFDNTDHQAAYIYTPGGAVEDTSTHPAKRRKVGNVGSAGAAKHEDSTAFQFDVLLKGVEMPHIARLRQRLYEEYWAQTEERIQKVTDEANEGTLSEVTSFANKTEERIRDSRKIPAGFIATGPNIASQDLLFKQLSVRLKSEINGPVVILRSTDASNLKAVLKQIIRETTNQKPNFEDDDISLTFQQDGRKLLNYDLEALHAFVKTRGTQSVAIAFQDSEAFDTALLADIIILFNSWLDRIPFVFLFGIATSIDLFHERLPKAASRCLQGAQFDVEQTSLVLERVFQKAVAGYKAPIRLGSALISSLLDRQQDHVQSVQSFTAAIKYAYMCHFYGNPLSFLSDVSINEHSLLTLLTPGHYEAIRLLPSFKKFIEDQVKIGSSNARDLIEDDEALSKAIESQLKSRKDDTTHILRTIHVLASCSPEPVDKIDLYMAAFEGELSDSELVRRILDSTMRMGPDQLLLFFDKVRSSIDLGCSSMELAGWADEASDFLGSLSIMQAQVVSLIQESKESGKPVRSAYAIHNKGLRTTVIAQKVQLSYENSTLSKHDEEFTKLIDLLGQNLRDLFTCENPQDLFLHEIWLYDQLHPYTDVFTPRPRHSMEHALSAPHDYLACDCCKSDEGISVSQPATASIYQMYLEAGSQINIFDLWRAFLDVQNANDEEDFDEREALVLFYRSLADLKSLGMVKQSKKKADHITKVAWQGL